MDFNQLCLEIFLKTISRNDLEKTNDLHKDYENYNKATYYLENFGLTDKNTIINFICNVRMDNLIYTTITQLPKATTSLQSPKRLCELNSFELYNELLYERNCIILKGTLDSIRMVYILTDNQSRDLANRIVQNDPSIFEQYKLIF